MMEDLLQNEDIKFKIAFDLVINLKDKSYISNIILDLPCEDNLTIEGTSSKEITDNFVFKRVRN